MELEHEQGGIRRWRMDGGTYREQRAAMYGRRGVTPAKTFDESYPEVQESMARMLQQSTLGEARKLGELIEGSATMITSRLVEQIYLFDEVTGDYLTDVDGDRILDPEYPDGIEYVVMVAEVGFWPTMEEDDA